MPRWIRPVLWAFGVLFFIYVVLLNRNSDLRGITRFKKPNSFDIRLETEQFLSENETKEVFLVEQSGGDARAECHDSFIQEKSDIQIKGQNVVYDHTFVTSNITDGVVNVHLVFHSHIDPGWLMTFEEYYNDKVRYILDNAIKFLSIHNDARFIWSEMSYLFHFYNRSTPETQNKIKKLISTGQIELCGGAWVMTDEATPYFWSTIDNIIEGQRFIYEEFNVSARSSWSVDPFGHGAAVPYLLSLTSAEVQNLVIGRLDKHVKENMAHRKVLLFSWAQPWNTGLEADLPLVSSLPRTYYTTVDSCGPDPSVCCQFDFGNTRSTCSDRARLERSTIEKYARMLTGQYRQVHSSYQTKQMLIPIGDDFFFSEYGDFVENYKNYRQLIDHVNTNPQYRMNIKFSTVNEYFDAIRAEKRQNPYPVLRGDFFPYTENKDGAHPYWTGYFVHRPFFKRLERVVQGQLRRLDILRVLLEKTDQFELLQLHRRNLALVQHHDAITGTSKPHVMKDYTERLLAARSVFKQLEADALGGLDYVNFIEDKNTLEFNDQTQKHQVTIFSQGTSTSPQRISVVVNRPNVGVVLLDGSLIKSQVFPWMDSLTFKPSNNLFELLFYIRIPALGSRQVVIFLTNETQLTDARLDEEKNFDILNDLGDNDLGDNLNASPENTEKGLVVDCGTFTLRFDENGLLQSFKRNDENEGEIKLRMSYGYYSDHGGAYVFAPNGHQKTATLRNNGQEPTVIRGAEIIRVYSRLQFSAPKKYQLYQVIDVHRNQSSKSIEIRVDLISSPVYLDGLTFVTNLETTIENNDSLFTDVNGLYLTRREMNDNTVHSGNFYPAPTSALIEDHAERVTVLFGQSTGITTTSRGHLEFFVDRNVKGSDGKGLDYGDSSTEESTHLHYRILIEKRDVAHAHKTIYLSRHAHSSLELLLHPSSVYQTMNAKTFFGVLWPCNVQLVNIRHLKKPEATLLIMRKLDFDCTVMEEEQCANTGNDLLLNTLKSLFPSKKLRFTSLTGIENGSEIFNENELSERLKPFQLVALKYE